MEAYTQPCVRGQGKGLSSWMASTGRQKPELSLEGDRVVYEDEGRAFLVEGAPGASQGLQELKQDLALRLEPHLPNTFSSFWCQRDGGGERSKWGGRENRGKAGEVMEARVTWG